MTTIEKKPEIKWLTPGKGTYTPWGKADGVYHYAPGINSYITPSHGGFHLSPARMAQLPQMIKDWFKSSENGWFYDECRGWFEEDCNWCFVVLAFPVYFTEGMRESAISTCRRWIPEFELDKYLWSQTAHWSPLPARR